jgi:hypothetical protein
VQSINYLSGFDLLFFNSDLYAENFDAILVSCRAVFLLKFTGMLIEVLKIGIKTWRIHDNHYMQI